MMRRRWHRVGQRSSFVHIRSAISARFAGSLRGCNHYPRAAKADESREGRHTVYKCDEESIVSPPNNLHIADIRNIIPAVAGVRCMRVALSESKTQRSEKEERLNYNRRTFPTHGQKWSKCSTAISVSRHTLPRKSLSGRCSPSSTTTRFLCTSARPARCPCAAGAHPIGQYPCGADTRGWRKSPSSSTSVGKSPGSVRCAASSVALRSSARRSH